MIPDPEKVLNFMRGAEFKQLVPAPVKLIRVRKLTHNQVDLITNETECIEEEGCNVKVGRTYVDATFDMLDAVYERLVACDVEDVFNNIAAETDAQEAMALRSAHMSLSSVCAKLAFALGYTQKGYGHERAATRIKTMSAITLLQGYNIPR